MVGIVFQQASFGLANELNASAYHITLYNVGFLSIVGGTEKNQREPAKPKLLIARDIHDKLVLSDGRESSTRLCYSIISSVRVAIEPQDGNRTQTRRLG